MSVHWLQPPIIFEVNIGQKVNIGRISKIANFHLIDLKFEEGLYFRSLYSTSQLFLRSTLVKRSTNIGQISKIANFHLIDLKFEEGFHVRSLTSTTNYF